MLIFTTANFGRGKCAVGDISQQTLMEFLLENIPESAKITAGALANVDECST